MIFVFILGVLKADNNVITHQFNELRTKSQEYVNEIENLKTRITVLQEDNKNIRLKSEDSVLKVKEKEVIFKELQDNLSEAQQKLYAEQIKVWDSTRCARITCMERANTKFRFNSNFMHLP